jgi:hypothetical protein
MKCIVTMTARRKNAKSHIAGRYDSVSEATTAAMRLNKKYIVTIVNGKWELIARRCEDENGNLYMEWE